MFVVFCLNELSRQTGVGLKKLLEYIAYVKNDNSKEQGNELFLSANEI